MKRAFLSLVLLLLMLSACNNKEAETDYYLSLSGESEHWKLNGYEMMITPEGYKSGNGILTMKNVDEHMANFFSFDAYAIVDGEENRFHGHSVSGETNIAEQTLGTIDGEEKSLKNLHEFDEIYILINWNDQDTNGDREEKIVLYNKNANNDSFLDEMVITKSIQ